MGKNINANGGALHAQADGRSSERFLQALRRPSWLVERFPNLFHSPASASWFINTRKQQLIDARLAVETPNGLLIDSEGITEALPVLLQQQLDPGARRIAGETAPRATPTGRPRGRPRKDLQQQGADAQ